MKGKKLSKKAVIIGVLIIVVCIGAVLYSMVGDKIGVPSAEELIDGAFGAEPCDVVEYNYQATSDMYSYETKELYAKIAMSYTIDVDNNLQHTVGRAGTNGGVLGTSVNDVEHYYVDNFDGTVVEYTQYTDGWSAMDGVGFIYSPSNVIDKSKYDSIELMPVSQADTSYVVHVSSTDPDFIAKIIGLTPESATGITLSGVLTFDRNSKLVTSIQYWSDADVAVSDTLYFSNLTTTFKPSKFNAVSVYLPDETAGLTSGGETEAQDVENTEPEVIESETDVTEGEPEVTEGETEATEGSEEAETESEVAEPTE